LPSLSQAKTLGGVGSILVILSIIPYAGFVVGIIGWILILLAIKNISDAMQDRAIFNNAMIAVILAIVGVAIAGVVIAGTIFSFIGLRYTFVPGSTTIPSNMISLVGRLIAGLAVVWIVAIIAAFFLRKSFNEISTKLNVGMFRTGALLYFIGAILTIIFVGFILIFVAEILFAVAFFGIPDSLPATFGSQMPPPAPGSPQTMIGAPPSGATKYCVKCGASMDRSVSVCPSCGAAQPAM
jgi:uncharacterized membrane protein